MGKFENGKSDVYTLNRQGNGVYIIVIEGSVEIDGQILEKRDGLGIRDVDELELVATENAKVLLMEVPMQN